MQPNKSSDEVLPKILVVENPQVIRLLFSKKHSLILKQISVSEQSISDIARTLKLNPGSVHYYLKELEKHGLVRQVRQEIKGGIVKKYYRAAAQRIAIAGPDFENPMFPEFNKDERITDRFLESMELFGYYVSPETREDAKELLNRYRCRTEQIFLELDNSRHRTGNVPDPELRMAGQLIFHIRAMDDPELDRIYHSFNKLFLKIE